MLYYISVVFIVTRVVCEWEALFILFECLIVLCANWHLPASKG